MSILSKLASALGRRDEVPNRALAVQIVKQKDGKAVSELVGHLHSSDKNIQGDCIKVLYEIGEQAPELISSYCKDFGKILESKNNRLAWGAMTALDSIALQNSKEVYKLLPKIMSVAEKGTVITRDHAVGILSKLGSQKSYATACFPLLLEQLKSCPTNQFAMYAEKALVAVSDSYKREFVRVLSSRLHELPKDSQKKRIEKVIRKTES